MALSRDEEKALIDHLCTWIEDAKEAREVVAGANYGTWQKYWDAYNRAEPERAKVPWFEARCTVNLLRARVDRIIGLYVSDRPRTTYEPQEPEDELLAQYLETLCENDWTQGGMDRELRAVETDAAVIGTGIWKTWHDPAVGRIRTRRIPSDTFLCASDSDLMLNDCEFVGEETEVPLGKVISLYPDIFKKDGGGAGGAFTEGRTYKLGDALPSYPIERLMDPHVGSKEKGASAPRYMKAKARLCEFWVRDIASVSWMLSEETQKRITAEKTKAVCITVAGDRVLEIKETKTPKSWHPYTVFRNALRGDSWWGAGLVAYLISPQEALDTIISRTVTHVQMTVNPTWIGDSKLASEQPSSYSNKPGNITWIDGGQNALQPQKMPDLPGAAIGVMQLLVSFMDDESGVNEAAQGKKPKGIESGRGIMALQQQMAQRNQQRLNDLGDSLKHWGTKYADLAIVEYKQKQVERLIGKQPGKDWSDLVAKAKGDLDVRVAVGTGVELDPETIVNSVTQLVQLGVFGQPGSPEMAESVLSAMKRFWPGADEKLRDLEKKKKAAFNAQAQAMAGQEAPPSPEAGPVPPPAAAPAPMPPAPEPMMAGAPV